MRHLVWDWNGTLLDDLALVVEATNASLATVGGPQVTSEEHRRDFRRPISDYYAHVLGRPVADEEFRVLDRVFHEFYRAGLYTCRLALDALDAITAWRGTQSLLSMFSIKTCWRPWPGTACTVGSRAWMGCETPSAADRRPRTCGRTWRPSGCEVSSAS